MLHQTSRPRENLQDVAGEGTSDGSSRDAVALPHSPASVIASSPAMFVECGQSSRGIPTSSPRLSRLPRSDLNLNDEDIAFMHCRLDVSFNISQKARQVQHGFFFEPRPRSRAGIQPRAVRGVSFKGGGVP